jgi:hypothetical protein
MIGAVCIPGSIRRTGVLGSSCANAAPDAQKRQEARMHALAVIMSPRTKLAFPSASLGGVLRSLA